MLPSVKQKERIDRVQLQNPEFSLEVFRFYRVSMCVISIQKH